MLGEYSRFPPCCLLILRELAGRELEQVRPFWKVYKGNPCRRLLTSSDLSAHAAAAVSSLIKVFGIKSKMRLFESLNKSISLDSKKPQTRKIIFSNNFKYPSPQTGPRLPVSATATAMAKTKDI